MSRRRKAWQREFDVAALVLKDEPGSLIWASDDYVAFRYQEPMVRIVFYPHRTSAMNYHLRIRDEGSKDKQRFQALADRLYIGSGYACTFSMKNRPLADAPPGVEPGWAAKQVLGVGRR